MQKKLPTFWYERRLWNKGHKIVVGLDEVGRGALAGPLVVGAVVFRATGLKDKKTMAMSLNEIESLGVDDSKRLSVKRREILARIITREAMYSVVTEVSVSAINRVGIGKATQMGFRKAISLLESVDFALIDAFRISRAVGLPERSKQRAIIKGDQKSISIAAASIVAKVYRDKLMHKLSQRYTKYGWSSNVGYGTLGHRKAIKKHGVTRWHRKQFVIKWLGEDR